MAMKNEIRPVGQIPLGIVVERTVDSMFDVPVKVLDDSQFNFPLPNNIEPEPFGPKDMFDGDVYIDDASRAELIKVYYPSENDKQGLFKRLGQMEAHDIGLRKIDYIDKVVRRAEGNSAKASAILHPLLEVAGIPRELHSAKIDAIRDEFQKRYSDANAGKLRVEKVRLGLAKTATGEAVSKKASQP